MGGSAREWSTNIEDRLEPGSPIEMRLVMTNFGSEILTVGYLVVLSTES